MEDDQQPSFDKIENFRIEVLEKILPNARFSSLLFNSSVINQPTDFSAKLSTDNLFEKSDYEYKGDGKFIHFTSILSLKAILESGFFRMSGFDSLLDKNELTYASKVFSDHTIFKCDSDSIEELKNEVFCISACESNDETKRDDFMWEVYGNKGNGVIIEFEFTQVNSSHFSFGKVLYGIEHLKKLKELKEDAIEFSERNDNFFPNDFQKIILEIQSFHKSKRYQIENEVRLLMVKTEDYNPKSVYLDINSNLEVRNFNKLFLKGRNTNVNYNLLNEECDFSRQPEIKILNIILGHNISDQLKYDLVPFFNNLKKEYDFNISFLNDESEILAIRNHI